MIRTELSPEPVVASMCQSARPAIVKLLLPLVRLPALLQRLRSFEINPSYRSSTFQQETHHSATSP